MTRAKRSIPLSQVRESLARVLDAPDMPPPPELVEAFGGVNADLLFAVVLAYVAGVIDAGGDVDL